MLLLMNQQQQQQQPPPFPPPISVSVPLSSSMGEQTQPQVPVQTQIHHHPQSHPQAQLSIDPQIQPQAPIQTQTQSQPQIQSQTQLQPQIQSQTQLQPQIQSQTQLQPQPQPQSQLQPQSQPQTQTLPDNPPQLQPNATIQAVDATTAGASSTQYSSSASKIPFRPRKTRKLSAYVSTGNSESKAPQAVDGDNATLTNVTAGNKKNSRGKKTTATAISATITTTTVVNDGNGIVVQPVRVIPRIVGKTLSCEGEVAAAIRHLRAVDPQLSRIIDVYQPPSFDTFQPPFLALSKSILYQQLAYKAGTSIYARFVALCGGESGVVPDAVFSLSLHQLRQIGVSARKASYLHDLASKYRKGILSDSSIFDMDDKSLFAMLTMVKGIGSWSVHMFMIFSLHRPDVLPVGDLGFRKGVQLLYGLEQLPRPSQMEQLCEKWRPYRSVGAWYMWRFAEAKGAQASAAAVAVGASQPQLQQQQPPPQTQQHQLLDPIDGIASLG